MVPEIASALIAADAVPLGVVAGVVPAYLIAQTQHKLVLDWRKRQQSRAAVELAIQDLVWQLPKCYTDTLCKQKSAAVCQHVYDSYYGAGQSVYAAAG